MRVGAAKSTHNSQQPRTKGQVGWNGMKPRALGGANSMELSWRRKVDSRVLSPTLPLLPISRRGGFSLRKGVHGAASRDGPALTTMAGFSLVGGCCW